MGDIRAAVRVGGELLGVRVPFALRAGIKLPGSEFPVNPRVLPLTEGQRDLEVSLESGWVGDDLPVYLVGWVGYRWRGPNRTAGFEPGDEWFGHVALGGQAGNCMEPSASFGMNGLKASSHRCPSGSAK